MPCPSSRDSRDRNRCQIPSIRLPSEDSGTRHNGGQRSDVVWVGREDHGSVGFGAKSGDMSISYRLAAATGVGEDLPDPLGESLVRGSYANRRGCLMPGQARFYLSCAGGSPTSLCQGDS